MTPALVLIDDNQTWLDKLETALRGEIGAEAEVIGWLPTRNDDAEAHFGKLIEDHDVRLVVTDYDLTKGAYGLFGATIVDWCQKFSVPVGDFSRGKPSALPTEPNLFELRVPTDLDKAVRYVSTVLRGFVEIRKRIGNTPELLRQRSPAAALALMLHAKPLESQFSQYGARYAGANPALVDALAKRVATDPNTQEAQKEILLTYITGHLLANGILRYPGPIAGRDALAAYLAIDESAISEVSELLADTRYSGPFDGLDEFFWVHRVDAVLDSLEERISDNETFESQGSRRRRCLELALRRQLARAPKCPRCAGLNGGFLCPFTRSAVCERSDCSVVSNVWIPAGARLCRFEKEFYDEWAPILGM